MALPSLNGLAIADARTPRWAREDGRIDLDELMSDGWRSQWRSIVISVDAATRAAFVPS